MKENSNQKITLENLDFHLGSMGFLYPTNEIQLEIFNLVYSDYDFKLKDATIDVQSIIDNKSIKKSITFKLSDYNTEEIEQLKMAARKGNDDLSKDIIDKMYNKHRKKSDDK